MKTRNKALLLTLCALMLVAASVLGTMAYLTSQDAVTNTFTVGNVAITMDEKDVDNSTENAERDKANAYQLMPGKEYEKDPTVHVASTSESCWLFVKVENGIAAYEAATETATGGYKNIEEQIGENGWTALTGVNNVYYKEWTKGTSDVDQVVFSKFKIKGDANTVTGWTNISAESTKITVTAYAVQKDGFTTAKDAWNATFGAPTT